MSGQKNDVTYAATVAFAVAQMRELGWMPPSNTSTDPPQDDMIERLRAVEWEETDDCGRMPDDPTHKCVFVDMRPDDFRALLREAADALEAAREDACVLRRDNELLAEALRSLAANWDERGNTVLRQARDADESEVSRYHITAGALAGCAHELRAAIDQARKQEAKT